MTPAKSRIGTGKTEQDEVGIRLIALSSNLLKLKELWSQNR